MSPFSARTPLCDACGTGQRGPAHVVCPDCWYRVPKALRNAVWNAMTPRKRLDAVQGVMEWLVANPAQERGEQGTTA
jgi:hypothetical protein